MVVEKLQEFVQDCLEELMPQCQRDRPRNYIGGNRDPSTLAEQPPSAHMPHLSETADTLTTVNLNATTHLEDQHTYHLTTEWLPHQGDYAPPDLLSPHSTDQFATNGAVQTSQFEQAAEIDHAGNDWLPRQGAQYPTTAQTWVPLSVEEPLPSLPFHGTRVANQHGTQTQGQFHNDAPAFHNFDEQYGHDFGN